VIPFQALAVKVDIGYPLYIKDPNKLEDKYKTVSFKVSWERILIKASFSNTCSSKFQKYIFHVLCRLLILLKGLEN